MIIKGKKIGLFIGFLTVLVGGIMMIGNIFFDKNFSYIAIGASSSNGALLLAILSTDKQK